MKKKSEGKKSLQWYFAISTALFFLILFQCFPKEEKSYAQTAADFGGYRPNYQGFGATSQGGRTGESRVCRITTLDISGTPTWGETGDARDCLEGLPPGCDPYTGTQSACARYVVSDVSGYTGPGLGHNMTISITGPYLHFAGQTAPSCQEGTGSQGCENGAGGLSFVGVQIIVDAHDVVLQHIRMRTLQGTQGAWGYYDDSVSCSGVGCTIIGPLIYIGYAGDDGDNQHVYNSVLDHVSLAWGGGGTFMHLLSGHGGTDHALITDSLFGEPVEIGQKRGGGYSGGAGGESDCSVTYARNAFINSWGRSPHLSNPCQAAIYNNIVYNGTDNTSLTGGAIYGQFGFFTNAYATGAWPGQIVYTNNEVIPGPDSGSVSKFMALSVNAVNIGLSQLYLQGNKGPGITGPTDDGQWTGVFAGDAWPEYFSNAAIGGPGSNVRMDAPPSWWNKVNFAEFPASSLRETVLPSAGARPLDRDAADVRMVADVTQGDGTHFLNWDDIQNKYGGLPAIVERSRPVAIPVNAAAPGDCGSDSYGQRSVLRCFLENDPSFGARRLEGSHSTNPPSSTPSPNLPPAPDPSPSPDPTTPTNPTGPILLTPSATTVTIGNPVSVSWSVPPVNSAWDWIALTQVDSPDNSYDPNKWIYTNGASSGIFNTTAPDQPGQYEFRYLLNDGFEIAGRSAPITVSTNVSIVPTVSLSVTPTTIASGSTATLTWSSANVSSCTASGAWSGAKLTANTQTVSPITNSTYALTCTGINGTATQSATISVNSQSKTRRRDLKRRIRTSQNSFFKTGGVPEEKNP